MVEALDELNKQVLKNGLSRPLRIVMLIPNFGMGGAQRSFLKLANWISEKHQVTIVAFDDRQPVYYSSDCKIEYLLRKEDAAGFASRNMTRIKRLKEIKKTAAADISISFLEGADYLNMVTDCGEKKIISIRGSKKYDPHISGMQGWIRKNLLIPFLYRKADRIITASRGLNFEMKLSYPALKNKLVTIPNGYKEKTLLRKEFNDQFFVLGWSGRLGDEKGLLELCSVFAECRQANNNFRLMLLGHGNFKNNIIAFLTEAGIPVLDTEKFEMEAFNNYDVIISDPGPLYETYLSRMDLFALTSSSEGFPNVIIEAMQNSIPVISTDARWGPREILAPGMEYDIKISYPCFAEYGVILPVISEGQAKENQSIWVTTLLGLSQNQSLLQQYSLSSSAAIAPYNETNIKKMWEEQLLQLASPAS